MLKRRIIDLAIKSSSDSDDEEEIPPKVGQAGNYMDPKTASKGASTPANVLVSVAAPNQTQYEAGDGGALEKETVDPFTSPPMNSISTNPMDLGRPAAPPSLVTPHEQLREEQRQRASVIEAITSVPKSSARRPPAINNTLAADNTSSLREINSQTMGASDSIVGVASISELPASPKKAPATVRIYKKPSSSTSDGISPIAAGRAPKLNGAPTQKFVDADVVSAAMPKSVTLTAVEDKSSTTTVGTPHQSHTNEPKSHNVPEDVTTEEPSLVHETNQSFPLPNRRRRPSATSFANLSTSDGNTDDVSATSGKGILLPTSERFSPPPQIHSPTTRLEGEGGERVKESLETEDRRSASPVVLNNTNTNITEEGTANTSSRNASPILWRPTAGPPPQNSNMNTAETIDRDSDSDDFESDNDGERISGPQSIQDAKPNIQAPNQLLQSYSEGQTSGAVGSSSHQVTDAIKKEIDDALAAAAARANERRNQSAGEHADRQVEKASVEPHQIPAEDRKRKDEPQIFLDLNSAALNRYRDSVAFHNQTIPDINSQEVEIRLIFDRLNRLGGGAVAGGTINSNEHEAGVASREGLNDDDGDLFNARWGENYIDYHHGPHAVAAANVKRRNLLLLGHDKCTTSTSKRSNALTHSPFYRPSMTETANPQAKAAALLEHTRSGSPVFSQQEYTWTANGLERVDDVKKRMLATGDKGALAISTDFAQGRLTHRRDPSSGTSHRGQLTTMLQPHTPLIPSQNSLINQNPAKASVVSSHPPNTAASALLAQRQLRMSSQQKGGHITNQVEGNNETKSLPSGITGATTATGTDSLATSLSNASASEVPLKGTTKPEVYNNNSSELSTKDFFPPLIIVDDLRIADNVNAQLLAAERECKKNQSTKTIRKPVLGKKPIERSKTSSSKNKENISVQTKAQIGSSVGTTSRRTGYDNNNFGVGSRTAIGLPKVEEFETTKSLSSKENLPSTIKISPRVQRKSIGNQAMEAEMDALKKLLGLKPTRGASHPHTNDDEDTKLSHIVGTDATLQNVSIHKSATLSKKIELEHEDDNNYATNPPQLTCEENNMNLRSGSAHVNLYEPALVTDMRKVSPLEENTILTSRVTPKEMVALFAPLPVIPSNLEEPPTTTTYALLQRLAAAAATLSPMPARSSPKVPLDPIDNQVDKINYLVHHTLTARATENTNTFVAASVDPISHIDTVTSLSPVSPLPRSEKRDREPSADLVSQLQDAIYRLDSPDIASPSVVPPSSSTQSRRLPPPPAPSPPDNDLYREKHPSMHVNFHCPYSRYYDAPLAKALDVFDEKENLAALLSTGSGMDNRNMNVAKSTMADYKIGNSIPTNDLETKVVGLTPPPKRRAPPPPPTYD